MENMGLRKKQQKQRYKDDLMNGADETGSAPRLTFLLSKIWEPSGQGSDPKCEEQTRGSTSSDASCGTRPIMNRYEPPRTGQQESILIYAGYKVAKR